MTIKNIFIASTVILSLSTASNNYGMEALKSKLLSRPNPNKESPTCHFLGLLLTKMQAVNVHSDSKQVHEKLINNLQQGLNTCEIRSKALDQSGGSSTQQETDMLNEGDEYLDKYYFRIANNCAVFRAVNKAENRASSSSGLNGNLVDKSVKKDEFSPVFDPARGNQACKFLDTLSQKMQRVKVNPASQSDYDAIVDGLRSGAETCALREEAITQHKGTRDKQVIKLLNAGDHYIAEGYFGMSNTSAIFRAKNKAQNEVGATTEAAIEPKKQTVAEFSEEYRATKAKKGLAAANALADSKDK